MYRHCFLLWLAFGFIASDNACHAVDLNYYLPDSTTYDQTVPTPESSLGYQVGEWHVRHDQMVAYLKLLARKSNRINVQTIGRTYEHRELLLLTITSPAHQQRLEDIRQEHLKLSQPDEPHLALENMPAVLYMGYSVHGDESSGGNAALLVAYHLAAAQGPEIEALLDQTVILLDPCLNPDGFNRFAQWANSHRGKHPVGDENHREHLAVWPAGRGNHYWFDLNRDWLLLRHPESRARIRHFHRWKPNIHTDFHEMGSHSTFFFQPGVPERKNPLTPEANVTLTQTIAGYHAKALDAIGSLYYTEERFDDYYYGKGSTYPDINGGIGILFEQASSRGHLRESPHGEFDFPFTIRNQFLTSLSTFQAALDHRLDLLKYQREFFAESLELSKKSKAAGFVFGHPTDPARNWHLLEVLLQHDIRVHHLAETMVVDDQEFNPGAAYVVPMRQPQYRLARTILERQTDFPDNIFYDVSSWTFPLAMGIPHAPLNRIAGKYLGKRVKEAVFPSHPAPDGKEAYAYAFEWQGHYAPRALYRLLDAKVRTRVATKPFKAHLDLGLGTIVIPMGNQEISSEKIEALLREISAHDGIKIHPLSTGLTPQGIDLGSPSLRPLEKPVPLLLVGQGINPYEAGEVWHLLDHRYDLQVTLSEMNRLKSLDLDRYTHLILVHGSYSQLSDGEVEKIKNWITKGGVLIALKSAAKWAVEKNLAQAEFIKEEEEPDKEKVDDPAKTKDPKNGDEKKKAERLAYGDFEKLEDAKRLSGTFFSADLDITHPIGFGYTRRDLALFRNSRLYMKRSKNPYGTVALYDEEPLLSGYVHPEELEKLKGTASIIAEKSGKGAIILMMDNPNFRGYTLGTTRLFLNALFFGGVLDKTKEH